MNNATRQAIIVTSPDTGHYWQATPSNITQLAQMDDDYLANVLRLIERRRQELTQVMAMRVGVMDSFPDRLNNLIEEDERFIQIIIDEFNRREEVFEDE